MRARIDIRLPVPPSVNHAKGFNRETGAVFRRRHYKRWIKEAGLEFIAVRSSLACKGLPTAPYGFRVRWPEGMRADADNPLKQLCDFLVLMRITPDDSLCRHISVGFSPSLPPGTCLVRVWSIT